MAGKYEGIKVEIDGDSTKLSTAMNKIKRQASSAVNEVKKLQQALNLNPGNTEVVTLKQKALQKAIEATTKKIETLQSALDNPNNGIEKGSEQWAQITADIERAKEELRQYNNQLAQDKIAPKLKTAQDAARDTKQELEALNMAMKLDPGNTDVVVRKQEALKRAITNTKEELNQYKALAKAADEGKLDYTEKEWAELQQKIAECTHSIQEFEQEQKNMAADSSGLARMSNGIVDASNKLRNASRTVSDFGDKYTHTVTLGMGAAAVAAVKSVVSIDDALTDVRKTVNGTEEDYERLKDAAIEFSQTNAVSPETILQLDALGAQLGFSLDELEQFGRVASGLDIATNMSAEQAATEMAHFRNIMGKANVDIERYASTIVALGNSTATTEADISSMSQRIASAGKSLGMSTADVLGLSAALSSLGLEAEGGGSAIATIMANIDMDVAKNNDNLQTWADTARMSAEEFANAWKSNPVEALQAVLTGMQQSVDEGGNLSLLLSDLGVDSLRQTDAMKRLANSEGLLADTVKIANDAYRDNTALSDEVANRNNSLSSQFEMLKNRVKKLAIEVGEPLAKALMEAIDAMEPLFKTLEKGAEAFSKMSEEEQQATLKAAAAVAGFGPLLSIVGRLGFGVSGAMSAFGKLGQKTAEATSAIEKTTEATSKATGMAATLKGGLIGLGVAATAVAAALAIKAWQDYQQNLKDTADSAMSLAEMEGKVDDALDGHKVKINEATGEVTKLTGSYKDAIKAADETIKQIADTNRGFVNAMSEQGGKEFIADEYLKTIEELSSKSTLAADEQVKLAAAVKGFNDVTGMSVSIIDPVTGALSVSTDVLKANTAAWKENAEIQIYTEFAQNAMRDRIQAEQDLKQVTDELHAAQQAQASAQDAYDEAIRSGDPSWRMYQENLNQASTRTAELEQKQKDLSAALESTKKNEEEATKKVADMTTKYNEQQAKLQQMRDVFGEYSDDVKQKMGDAKFDVEKFIVKMDEAGMGAEELRKVSDVQFDEMRENAGNDVDAIIQQLADLNGVKLDPKEVVIESSSVGNAISQIDILRNRLSSPFKQQVILEVQERSYSVGVNNSPFAGRNAAGAGVIQKHADGAALINHRIRTPDGHEFGENGIEAVFPLSNARYMRPIAKVMAGYLDDARGGGITYVINIDGTEWNSKQLTAETVEEFVTEVARKGDMNCG